VREEEAEHLLEKLEGSYYRGPGRLAPGEPLGVCLFAIRPAAGARLLGLRELRALGA
jgi:hypothetical protein